MWQKKQHPHQTFGFFSWNQSCGFIQTVTFILLLFCQVVEVDEGRFFIFEIYSCNRLISPKFYLLKPYKHNEKFLSKYFGPFTDCSRVRTFYMQRFLLFISMGNSECDLQ